MRGLLILAMLWQGLFASRPSQCKLFLDLPAAEEAVYLINKLHHHGYKFKLDSFTLEPKDPALPSCLTLLTLTLKETKCHIVNPKPFDECKVRAEHETPVTAKCNVSLCSDESQPGIARLVCDTEPASSEQLVRRCPDCPTLRPLHDPEGLESVKAAIEKFNKESNQTSYFTLLEVGRLSSQYNMMFGMSNFAEFAIVETECSANVNNEEKPACKQKCSNETHYGFCRSTQLGNGDLIVECEIYEVQNTLHPPFHRGKHCRHKHHPGHHERGEPESHPGHHGQGEPESRPGHHGRGDPESRPGHHGRGKPESRPGHHGRGEPESRPGHHGRGEPESPPGHQERGEHKSPPGHQERGEHKSPPGHQERGEHKSPPGHRERGDHEIRPGHPTRPGQPEHPELIPIVPPGRLFCFTRSTRHPFHRGPPHHGGHPHHRGPPHNGDHGERENSHQPHPTPTHSPQQGVPDGQPTPPGSEEHPDFRFPHCHGAVKIPPSIHPICPFPRSFYRRGQS